MNKETFLTELEQLLQGIPEEERRDVLDYYRDYIEDGGPEHEGEIIAGLGSPRKVAASVLSRDGGERGEYTERGYENPREREPFKELMPIGQDRERQKKWIKIGLVIFLVFFVVPRVLKLLGMAFGWSAGVLGTLFGLAVGAVLVTAGLLIAGVVLMFIGFFAVFHSAAAGIALYGSSMICLGLGLAGLVFCGRLYGKWIPAVLHSLSNWLGRLKGKRKGGEEL